MRRRRGGRAGSGSRRGTACWPNARAVNLMLRANCFVRCCYRRNCPKRTRGRGSARADSPRLRTPCSRDCSFSCTPHTITLDTECELWITVHVADDDEEDETRGWVFSTASFVGRLEYCQDPMFRDAPTSCSYHNQVLWLRTKG